MSTVIGAVLPVVAGSLLLLAQQAHAATVVTDNVISQAPRAQNNVAVTFGQVFKNGDVPRGAALVATVKGQPIPLQVDSKAINPDGSLRHAVLSVALPSLPGKESLPLTLSAQPTPTVNTQVGTVSLAQLLATGYDATASFDMGGNIYTTKARTLLQQAHAKHTCKPWSKQCNLWLSGPLVSEWVVNGLVTAADGTPHPDLRVYFAVRAYAGATPGTVGDIRTDIIVENTSAFAPQAQPQQAAVVEQRPTAGLPAAGHPIHPGQQGGLPLHAADTRRVVPGQPAAVLCAAGSLRPDQGHGYHRRATCDWTVAALDQRLHRPSRRTCLPLDARQHRCARRVQHPLPG
ncbi:hypothetical protein [Rhodanobacter sp. Root627]|uniref:RIFT barrel domain-containing protein n=1 Tax=Rhodanobacter sp. Root627 TaxID=1736572 RepID=UPI001F272DFE|nr:hypothetical protein [Rhodanobacter sp. Root627]